MDEPVCCVYISVVIIQDVPADPLSDVLALSGLSAACSVRLVAGGDWALRFRPIALKFNVVQRGSCWLLADGMPAVALQAGDCFVVKGAPFVLASDPGVPAVDAAQVFADSPHAAQALDQLCRTYWYPLYAFVRRKVHSPHDAQDLTQAFFARL